METDGQGTMRGDGWKCLDGRPWLIGSFLTVARVLTYLYTLTRTQLQTTIEYNAYTASGNTIC